MALLDSSTQCQGQPALWGQPWIGHGYSHLRLGSNCLKQLPLGSPMVGRGQHGLQYRIFLLVPRSNCIRETALLLPFASFPFLNIGICSTPTLGTALTFPWCPQTHLITQGGNITSLKSSILIPPSTFKLTGLTAPSSFPHHSPFRMVSRLQRSPPPLHILSSTTAHIYGLMPVAHSPNNLISTPA